jgi:hypothetical protein
VQRLALNWNPLNRRSVENKNLIFLPFLGGTSIVGSALTCTLSR